MKKSYRLIIYTLLVLAALVLLGLLVCQIDMAVMSPKGLIGVKQRDLLVFATLIMLIVVIPVFVLIFFVTWRYQEGKHKNTKYSPNWAHSTLAEIVWWGVPCIIIIILGTVNWICCYTLDPYRPIVSDKKAITIQVVALDWKWLFIYPDYDIATVNFIQFPKDVPVHFIITADAPMNSFWIPELGGQIFAMPGMRTELYLIANKEGSYKGLSANLSGVGFAGMRFTAKASSEEEFKNWISSVKRSRALLNKKSYFQLAKQSQNNPVVTYKVEDKNLFDWILMKDSMPHDNVR